MVDDVEYGVKYACWEGCWVRSIGELVGGSLGGTAEVGIGLRECRGLGHPNCGNEEVNMEGIAGHGKKKPPRERGLLRNMAPTYSPVCMQTVPSAMRGLTSLFGKGRGEHPRHKHHKEAVRKADNIVILGVVEGGIKK